MLKNKTFLMLALLIPFLSSAPAELKAAASLETPGINASEVEKESQTENQAEIQQQETSDYESQQNPKFAIGNIKLTSDEIEIRDYSSILASYENREVTMAELNDLSRILTKDLRSNGYPASTIYVPNQSFTQGGELILAVEPGHYGEITIDNQSKLPTSKVKGYFARLKKGEIIRSRELETAMNKLTSVGGIRAAGIFAAGKENGTADLSIKIQNGKKSTEILYAENYGTKSAGRYRYVLQGDVQFSEVAGTLNYALVFSNKDQHNYNLGYSQLLGHSATRLGLNISRSDYELGGAYRALGAEGDALTFGLSCSTPIYNTWKESFNFNYGYNYRKLEDEQKAFDVNMKKHSYSVYAGFDGMLRDSKSYLDYQLTYTAGRLKFDNDWARYVYGASNTEGNFKKTNFNARYIQTFNRKFDLQVKFAGQYANSNLDGSEEIVLGGINGVRAYPTGVGSGDDGYVTNIELRYHTKTPGLTFSTYFDMGHVKVTHDSNNPSAGGETAKGWGIGLNYTKPGDYFIRLDYARRIGGLDYYENSEDAKDKGRFWFMLGKVF